MSGRTTARLGDIVSIVGGGTPTRTNPDYYGGEIPWVTPKDMRSYRINKSLVKLTRSGLRNGATRLIPPNSILIVVRSGVLKHTVPVAVNTIPVAINQDMKALLCSERIDPHFLARFVKARSTEILRWVRATTADNFPIDRLRELSVPIPPVVEQQRIAKILDRADLLGAKRREAIFQLDELTRSIFLDMFGDPTENSMGWPIVRLAEILALPLRNGLSPSRNGQVRAKVLTLAAITGDEFKAGELKLGEFMIAPPANQTVDDCDLLICRGNGSIRLVGKGYFPTAKMPDVLFPDTVIAAQVSNSRVGRSFMQSIWNSNAVRRQIESVARTTNGTFKINQQMLEAISFCLPPLPLQKEFAKRVEAVERLKVSNRTHLAELDALFASLQDRAFRGEV